MRLTLPRLFAAAALLFVSACGGSDVEYFWLRAIHAIPDGPTLRAAYDPYIFRPAITYPAITNESPDALIDGARTRASLTLQYLRPDGSAAPYLATDVPVARDSVTNVVYAGSFAAPQVITVLTPRRPRPLAEMYFQFINAAPDLGPLDVYVTAADTDLTATAPFATVQPLGHSSSLQVPFGQLRFRLTYAGTLDVLYDSGEREFNEVTGGTGPGAEWLWVIMPNAGPGPSPALLMGNSGRTGRQLVDTGTTGTMRAYHAAPEAPTVDVVSVRTIPPGEDEDEDAEPDVEETLLYSGLGYRERSARFPAPVGAYQLEFRGTGEEGEKVASVAVVVSTNQEYTSALVGLPESEGALNVLTDARSVASEARLRLANLAPESQFFSAYLTRTEDEERGNDNLLFRDIPFRGVTGHVPRLPGDYFLTFTERFYETAQEAADAEETVTVGPIPVSLAGGEVLTYVFFAPEVEGAPELLEVFDDTAP